jgi:hypothetical protein
MLSTWSIEMIRMLVRQQDVSLLVCTDHISDKKLWGTGWEPCDWTGTIWIFAGRANIPEI